MITKFDIYEAYGEKRGRGRPKSNWVECIKDCDGVLDEEYLEYNPHLVYSEKSFYPFFEKGKMYKIYVGPVETITDKWIVYISTNIIHTVGPPDYEKFVSAIFYWYDDTEKDINYFSGIYFEDYFKLTPESEEFFQPWFEWWETKKEVEKYNI